MKLFLTLVKHLVIVKKLLFLSNCLLDENGALLYFPNLIKS